MKSVGFCLGASNVSMVIIDNSDNKINVIDAISKPHDGNARDLLIKMYNENNLRDVQRIAVTGRKLRNLVNMSSISEPEAIEKSIEYLGDRYNNPQIVVSAGGETFMIYELDKKGKIINVNTGNKCASGTGEFFLQQLKRMNVNVEDAMEIADIEDPHKLAGRCSVFCKSDCTHALNNGEPKGRVVAGLCQMMASKILELIKKTNKEKILIIGGTAKNKIMIDFLKKEKKDLLVAKEADYFEALGTAIWALENETKISNSNDLFNDGQSSFGYLPKLKSYIDKVTFKSMDKGSANENDRCIVGLDVGSTTTKAVLLRISDDKILASTYLRTNGDPIKASKECYRSLYDQIKTRIDIVGLGVTGSGRQIAGLHALTDGVINEIIAHATAAIHFDPEVETIFEIGGQDAKYTYITNNVPSDYAMNEACSAGTGSFLEESAKESMGIDTEDIADIALKSTNPPNFNDQCSAFISSDIKNAIQEGIKSEDILAGLVYSVCQNYSNRVKGNRPVGKKIFMQGGVCYNMAIPVAMAALTGNEIIVPPEPGLMGAYGVALEIKNKIQLGIYEEKNFDLLELSKREARYGKNFVCGGGKEKCDRGCNINVIEINDKKYPFGGSCNKYVNLQKNIEYDVEALDLVNLRENLVFNKYAPKEWNNTNGASIGITKSLLVNTLYPLYYSFFTQLGMKVVLSDSIDLTGIEKKAAPFCYPIEVSHGFMQNLINKNLDYYFLPQVKGVYVENEVDSSVVCPLVQGEPYYLKSTFNELDAKNVITPVLDFSRGYHYTTDEFLEIGKALGYSRKECIKAYKFAFEQQRKFQKELKEIGKRVIKEIESDPDRIGIALFGRPYNAFTKDTNMGIPNKFASRGVTIIPIDFLPYDDEDSDKEMYWSMGRIILKCAKYVKKHPQLFGTFITNFSCGPDSFIVGYFRNIMGQKPSLTLELDSHTADAGINTRIEAFLDVIKSYLELQMRKNNSVISGKKNKMADIIFDNGNLKIIDSDNQEYNLRDKNVHVLIPSMGDVASKLLAASLRYVGINASSLLPPTEKELKLGRGNSSCKECLPLILTVGGLLDYLENREDKEEMLVYFMPTASGPCRFGQYNVLMKNLIMKNNLKNIAVLSLSSENGYGGLGVQFILRAWRSVIISDVLDEIYSAILVLAEDKENALKIYNESVRKISNSVSCSSWEGLLKVLREVSKTLSQISLKSTIKNANKVGLIGEIFVRRDGFSRQYLVETLAKKDIIVKVAPVSEWIYYCDYLIKKNISENNDFKSVIKAYIQGFFKSQDEKTIKSIFAKSNLYQYHIIDVDKVIKNVQGIISPKLTGEAILTVGTAISEIIDEVSGIIAIGPFGCMPNRISEAIINQNINVQKTKMTNDVDIVKSVLAEYPSLPFLAIETDGNVFPQVIEARLELFCLQSKRLNEHILETKNKQSS